MLSRRDFLGRTAVGMSFLSLSGAMPRLFEAAADAAVAADQTQPRAPAGRCPPPAPEPSHATMTAARSGPAFSVHDIPFSTYGSWFDISPVIAEKTYAEDLHLVSHQNGMPRCSSMIRGTSRISICWTTRGATSAGSRPCPQSGQISMV